MSPKRRINKLFPRVFSEVSLVPASANQEALVLLAKRRSDGAEVGISFTPLFTDVAKAAPADTVSEEDPAELVATAFRHPPVASEPFAKWVSRVHGSLHGADITIAKALFNLFGQAAGIRAKATDRLEKMARERAQEVGETFHQSFAKICRTAPGEELYRLSKARLLPSELPLSDIAKAASDELAGIAARIQADEGLSSAQAFTAACKRNPSAYARSRGREK
jgi:hypothetical protein